MKFKIPSWGQVKKDINEDCPTILTITGLFSLALTVYSCVRYGPKVKEAVEEKKEELGDDYRKIDGFKAGIKPAIPIILSTGATATCMITSNRIAVRRINELTTAYEISEESLALYKKKAHEMLGDKKAAELRQEVNKEIVDKKDLKELPKTLKPGQHWFVDNWSGEKFLSDVDTVKNAKNVFNSQVIKYDGQCMNDFYYLLDLDPRTAGQYAGFDPDHLMELNLDPVEVDGQIIIFMDYGEGPYVNFRSY